MSAPRVTIIGSALSGNKGASAMLEAAIATLEQRLPDVEFTLLSMYPEADARLNDHDNLDIVAASPRQLGVTINLLALAHRVLPALRSVIERRSRAIGALARSQVMLDQGGITFTDGREKYLLYNTASVLPALNVRTPVVKCAQAIGPFRGRINRMVASWFLPRMEAIVTRGARTHAFAEELGLSNLHAGADYAFTLQLRGDEAEALAEIVDPAWFDNRVPGQRIVGVSPSGVVQARTVAPGQDYVTTMARFVDELVDDGHRVLVVPHSARAGSDKTHNNDLPLCRAIVAATATSPDVALVDAELPDRVLRHTIGTCDLFVASRFHAMVSSLAMQVPTVVVGWSHKYREVLEMFDLGDWAFDDSMLEPRRLADEVARLDASSDVVARKLAHHLPVVEARAAEQADLIADVVRRGLDVEQAVPIA